MLAARDGRGLPAVDTNLWLVVDELTFPGFTSFVDGKDGDDEPGRRVEPDSSGEWEQAYPSVVEILSKTQSLVSAASVERRLPARATLSPPRQHPLNDPSG